MDKKKILALFSVISTSVLALTVVFAAKPDLGSTFALMNRSNSGYNCNHIIFSETVNNPSKYANISDVSDIATTSIDCSMTEWTNANYGEKGATAIKIGGSTNHDGSVKLTLAEGVTATRAIVYAAEWSGDPGTATLHINEDSAELPTTTSGNYNFLPYTFDFEETNELLITNGTGNTGKRRIVISKIVLRLFGDNNIPIEPDDPSGGGGGGESQTLTATLIAGTNGSTCTVNGKNGIKVGTSKAGGDMSIKVSAGTKKLTFYAAAWKGVTNLSLNVTGGTCSPTSISLTADDGVSNNSPFTLVGTEADFKFELTMDLSEETTFKFTSSIAKRFVIWNASAE